MKNNKIILIIPILLLSLFFVSAISYDFTEFQNNNSINYTEIYSDSNYLIQLEDVTNKNYYYTNLTTGLFETTHQYYNGVNYGLKRYNSLVYNLIFGGGVTFYIQSVNDSYSVVTVGSGTLSGTSGGDRFGVMIGKYLYQRSGSTLKVTDLTNASVVSSASFSFDLSGTDCNIGATNLLPYGYDYDNDRAYFLCRYTNNTLQNELVYIESDFYNTLDVHNNILIPETEIFSINTPSSSLLTNMLSNNKFIVTDSNIYVINSSDISQILTSGFIDAYEGLTCNSDYSSCWDNEAVCFYNNFYSNDEIENFDVVGDYQCENATYQYGITCNTVLSKQCSGGCYRTQLMNAYNISYESANCITSNCTNECSINGQLRSDTLSSYQVCGSSYDSDGCLEWSPSILCSGGELSYGGICEAVNLSVSDITKLNFDVVPYVANYVPETNPPVLNTNLYNVTYDYNTRTINAVTTTVYGTGTFPLYEQIPYPDPNYYVSFDCDYKSITRTIPTLNTGNSKNKIYETINDSKTVIINGQNKEYTTISFIDNDDITEEEFSVKFLDVNTKVISDYYYVFNKTNGEFIVYDSNKTGSLLFTGTFQTGITLGEIKLEYYHNFNDLQSNSMLSLYRYVDNNNNPLLFTKGNSVKPYTDNLATTPYTLVITNHTSDLRLVSINSETITSNIFATTKLISGTGFDFINGYETTGCVYFNDGTYKQRVYLSEKLGGQYFSFVDVNIVKTDINKAPTTSGTSGGFNLGNKTKLFIGIFFPLIFGIILIAFGSFHDSILGKAMVFTGAFGMVCGTIAFSIAGWVDAWIIIIAIILASMGVGFFFMTKSNGGD
jgi:hypothetical protein